MGNAQSDREEDKAYNVIKWIPFVNFGYGVVRTAVYAGKGDRDRSVATAKMLVTGGIAGVAGATVGGLSGGGGKVFEKD